MLQPRVWPAQGLNGSKGMAEFLHLTLLKGFSCILEWEEGTTRFFKTFTLNERPESGLDCLVRVVIVVYVSC